MFSGSVYGSTLSTTHSVGGGSTIKDGRQARAFRQYFQNYSDVLLRRGSAVDSLFTPSIDLPPRPA